MIRLAVRRPVAVSMAYLCLALLGVAAWRNLPIELLPDTELPRLTVSATWTGGTPETVEALVTAPLEEAVEQVRGVSNVSSVSTERDRLGSAEVTVEFNRDTDMEFARLELSERLAALEPDLPVGVRGPYVQPYVPDALAEGRGPLLRFTATGPYTLDALRARLDADVAPALRQVDGVASVDVSGGRDRVLEVELDEARVLALGLRPDDVRRRLAALDLDAEAGVVAGPGGERRALAIRGRPESVADVLAAPVLTDRGRVVRVRDVARVHDTYADATSHYRIDGEPAVAFDVRKAIGGNSVAVADRVKAEVARLGPGLPSGMRLLLDADQSQAIRRQLMDLRWRALVSGAAVFLVLLIFLGSLRSAGIVFATLAFSILITLNLIYFGGLTLNVLTLMGLAMGFGLIVDNAIVVLENVYRRRRSGEPAAVAAERGAREVVLPVLAATLTTVVVLVPFVYLQGELRLYYVPLAIVVGFSLLASLLVAFTFIPTLAARLLNDVKPRSRIPADASGSPPEPEPEPEPQPQQPQPQPQPQPGGPEPIYLRIYRPS